MNSDSYNQTPDDQPAHGQPDSLKETDALSDAQTKLLEAEKKYLYLYSEFENFRRRTERDRLDFLKYGHESFLRDLLQVLDNFERAISHARTFSAEKNSSMAQVCQGIEMIHYQFNEALKSQGVSLIQTSGVKFDPTIHEAVSEAPSELESGSIVEEAQKGFLLHGRTLRAAKVVVAKK